MPNTRGQTSNGARSNDLFISFNEALVKLTCLSGIMYNGALTYRPE